MTNALSYKRPNEVWKTIHRIPHPSQQPITVYPDNKHFTSAAERLDASVAVDKEELHRRINALSQDPNTSFRLKSVTYHEVIRESKALRSDCSTGPNVGERQANDDFRPVFISPVLSKVYERLS